MNQKNKKYWLYWGNIVFLAINTAIFVFLLISGKEFIMQSNIDKTISNEFLRKELGFSDEQYNLIMSRDSLVQLRYHRVLDLLCQERYNMLNELARTDPSIDELNKIASSVGSLHRAMKIQTFHHILNIKKICTPEQLKKLDTIFMELLEINKYCTYCPHKCSRKEKAKRLSASSLDTTINE